MPTETSPERRLDAPEAPSPFRRGIQGIPIWILATAALLLLGGFALRMLDLSDPPLDFHPSRQLFSYSIARGLYYQMSPETGSEVREKAIHAAEETQRYEPRIQEGIVAVLYRASGGVSYQITRIYLSAIWMAGGVLLFLLAARIASPAGALFSLGYFLFVPFVVQASRSFQPDVLMVVSVVGAAYCLARWEQEPNWAWSLAAALVGGFAVLAKAQAIFPIMFMALLAVVSRLGLREAVTSPRVWTLAVIMALIPGFYYLGPWVEGGDYFSGFTIGMSGLLRDPGFFVRWANFIDRFLDMGVIVLAVLGTVLIRGRGKSVLVGLWVGYFVLGLFFPWQIHTHDYYSLVLVPTVALGLAPVGEILIERVGNQGWVWKAGFVAVCLFAVAYPAWIARSALLGSDYRNEVAAWRNMGEELPQESEIIALTHDYGWRLQYWGFRPVERLWPYTADYELHLARGGNLGSDFDAYFDDLTSGLDYFLLTAYSELDRQPELRAKLDELPVALRGDGYVLYSLNGQ